MKKQVFHNTLRSEPWRFAIFLKTIPRYINLFLGVVIFGALYRVFPTEKLSEIVVAYALAGLVLWVADLGSTYWMIRQKSVGNISQLRVEWSHRLIRLFVCGILAAVIFALMKGGMLYSLLLISCLWDLESDSGVGLRQVLFSNKNSIFIQLTKKVFQLSGLLAMDYFDSQSFLLFSCILFLPVVFFKVTEMVNIGGFSLRREHARKGKTLSMWLQSGYSFIFGLDVLVLDMFDLNTLIVSVAIGKKLANALFVPGSTLSIETLSTFSKHVEGSEDRIHLAVKVKLVFLVSLTISLILLLFLSPVLDLFLINQENSLQNTVIWAFILWAPFSSISAYWNSMLVGSGKFLSSGIQGYSCSLVYISSMLLFGSLFGFHFAVIVALSLKMVTELVLGRYLTRNMNSTN